ncbi:MAG: AI-2E family transporter [Natronomonas sp.]
MSSSRRRRYALVGLLAVVSLLTVVVLSAVVEVVFFAITVAYVLYPLRQRLVGRGLSRRVSSAITTSVAFVLVVALITPIVWTLVRRRADIVRLLSELPDRLPVEAFGFTYTVDVSGIVDSTVAWLSSVAVSIAANSIFIALQLALFVILLYGLLLRPRAVGNAVLEITPPAYHDILQALHDRIRGTLYALYVIQAATAVLTFPIAFVVFFLLGYESVFVLSVTSAILQFIPIVGPGMLAIGLAGFDLLTGATDRAIAVAILGPLLIGLLPDVILRPKLASKQAQLAASLYFVGFTGGVLTLGVIGIIAGPLVVAILVEVVDLMSTPGAPAEAGTLEGADSPESHPNPPAETGSSEVTPETTETETERPENTDSSTDAESRG